MLNRFIALAITAAAIAATPAAAASINCATTPAQIRTLAQTKGGEDAVKAIKLVTLGEKLCAADAKYEAGKKFSAAAKALGTDLASLSTATSGQ